jgi:hypothetical protein
MSETNPLQPVHKAIWTLLEANTAFTTLVSVSNRLKSVGSAGKAGKDQAKYADFPMVLVDPMDGLFVADFTNTDSDVVKTFSIKVATGNSQTDAMLELEWVIFVAISNWRTTMEALSWCSKTKYVKHVTLSNHEETLKERELTRSETGWATVLIVEVKMNFARTDVANGPG